MALAPLSAERWAANREAQRPASARAAERPPNPPDVEPAPPPDVVRPPGQVVDIGAANDKAPAESRFVSERNNTVEKETRSRHARPGYERALPVPSAPSASQTRAPDGEGGAGGEGGESPQTAAAAAASKPAPRADAQEDARDRQGEEPEAVRGERLAMGPGALERVEPSAPPAPSGEPGADGTPKTRRPGAPGRPGVKNPSLSPSASFYEGLAGGPAPDHLEGVEEGEATWLNTREWKYAGYFNRIKQAVADQWNPNRALALRDPTGEMFAYKDRITFVEVTLDDHGALKDVTVQKTSGVDFLDRTALEAFRKAQPFVNPPRGLANEQGEIKFTFGFYLQVGTAGMRVFRQPVAR